MAEYVSSFLQAAFAAVAMLILFAIVFVVAAGCYLVTVAVTDFAQVLQTPIPY